MLARDAEIILARLKIRASLDHLTIRTLYWAGQVYCVFLVLCSTSFVFDYGALTFHALILSSLTLLPLFLLLPSKKRSFIKTLRPYDIQATIETYLTTHKEFITKILKKQTEEALRIVVMSGFRRAKPGLAWFIGVACSTLIFISFQVASLKSGHGFFASYVERKQDAPTYSGNEGDTPGYDSLTLEGSPKKQEKENQAQEPLVGRSRRQEKILDDERLYPSVVLGDKEKARIPQTSQNAEKDRGTASLQDSNSDDGRQGSRGTNPEGDAQEKKATDSNPQNPGWEGTGTALQSNPLVNYTAYFERLYLEHSGTQTALSQIQTEGDFIDLISSYYASFTTIVDIKIQKNTMITAVKQSWKKTFQAGMDE